MFDPYMEALGVVLLQSFLNDQNPASMFCSAVVTHGPGGVVN